MLLKRVFNVRSAFNKGFIALDYPWRSTRICPQTNATMMLLATGSMSAVQANLGHASQRESGRYTKAVAALQTADADKTAAMIPFSLSKKSEPKSLIEEPSHFT
ncbi:MAG: hypothetical protein NTV34_20090 [Proteobacteria bacterium]|nr:hypothetical protein [Pseudomonadota bacterium]